MAKPSDKPLYLTDGSANFSGGVDSDVLATIQSQVNPDGLARNQLAWLINGSIRGGGIVQRASWKDLGEVQDGSALYQGGIMYDAGFARPYLLVLVGGNLYKVDIDPAFTVTNLSALSGLTLPPTEPHAYFVQAEEFVVIQAGDYTTLPLIWDGLTLRRSSGLNPSSTSELVTVTGTWVAPAPGSSVAVPVTTGWPLAIPVDVELWFPNTEVSAGTFTITSTGAFAITLKGIAVRNPGSTYPAGVWTFRVLDPNAVAEIPAAGPMDYYMGRIWYAQGRQYAAGDIVGGPSGTPAYEFRDSVLKVTENPLVIGGDGFIVPTQAGNIRAIKHSSNIDATLGEGQLFIGTAKAIYSLTVPVTRQDWIAATGDNQPLQKVVQLINGFVGDRSVVAVNGDLFYQSLEPGIRSLITAIRYFSQWGNTPISANEERILRFNDRALLSFSSGMAFDNRLYQTALPRQTAQGVVHDAIIPLDFNPVSSFDRSHNPVFEGMLNGMPILQLFTADFGGLERAFAMMVSVVDSSIRLWEITKEEKFENGDNRVSWQIEFPAFTWGKEFLLKRLVSAELWIDRIYGEVFFQMDYRPDGDPCWYPWHQWKLCSARNSCEDVFNPVCYPEKPFGETYKSTATLPMPPDSCANLSGRPGNVGYQFQPRLTIKGFCRIRGILLHAEPVERELYAGMVC